MFHLYIYMVYDMRWFIADVTQNISREAIKAKEKRDRSRDQDRILTHSKVKGTLRT